jgi:phage major head subunit gpT-like protein
MILNAENLTVLNTGFNVAFTQAFDVAPTTFERVASVTPSVTKETLYAWLGNAFRLREWLGDRHLQGLQTHDFRIKNRGFEGTVEIDRYDIEDDQYGVYTPYMQQMGQDTKVHPDTLIYPLLNAGFTNLCYDGQPFFDANHPVGDGTGGTAYVSNYQAGAGAPWFLLCTKRVVKPLIWQKRQEYRFTPLFNPTDPNVFFNRKFIYGVDGRGNAGYGLWQLAFGSKAELTPANFEAAYQAMLEFKNDNGLPMGIVPDLLVVPPSYRATGKRIVETKFQFASSTGGDNINYGAAELLVSPYLAL